MDWHQYTSARVKAQDKGRTAPAPPDSAALPRVAPPAALGRTPPSNDVTRFAAASLLAKARLSARGRLSAKRLTQPGHRKTVRPLLLVDAPEAVLGSSHRLRESRKLRQASARRLEHHLHPEHHRLQIDPQAVRDPVDVVVRRPAQRRTARPSVASVWTTGHHPVSEARSHAVAMHVRRATSRPLAGRAACVTAGSGSAVRDRPR